MKTERFDYRLPPERIAQEPLSERDASRLLVLRRTTRTWGDHTIRELPQFLPSGDLLVLNDTRVLPARLRGIRDETGGQIEILLLPPEKEGSAEPRAVDPLPSRERVVPKGPGEGARAPLVVRRVLTRSRGHLKVGEQLTLARGAKAIFLERLGEAGDRVGFQMSEAEFAAFVAAEGEVPLPPYIRRPRGPSTDADRARYQTVYARVPGAVAAPTAGLHFSPELLTALEAHGVRTAFLTLHVGPGTFRPVKTEEVSAHRVDPEPYEISVAAAAAVTQAKASGRRVIAVGTTVLRTLESNWDAGARRLRSGAGTTDLFVHPPFTFQVADALLTNFHLPKSSLLMLAAAFAAPGREDGIEWLRAAYAHAIQSGYRFFSYGDACLFL